MAVCDTLNEDWCKLNRTVNIVIDGSVSPSRVKLYGDVGYLWLRADEHYWAWCSDDGVEVFAIDDKDGIGYVFQRKFGEEKWRYTHRIG